MCRTIYTTIHKHDNSQTQQFIDATIQKNQSQQIYRNKIFLQLKEHTLNHRNDILESQHFIDTSFHRH